MNIFELDMSDYSEFLLHFLWEWENIVPTDDCAEVSPVVFYELWKIEENKHGFSPGPKPDYFTLA